LPALAQQKCFEHAAREASSQCLQCKRYFCRECVVEHEGRIQCTACLKALAAKPARKPVPTAMLYATLGFLLTWGLFYGLGRLLLLLPSAFHGGIQ